MTLHELTCKLHAITLHYNANYMPWMQIQFSFHTPPSLKLCLSPSKKRNMRMWEREWESSHSQLCRGGRKEFGCENVWKGLGSWDKNSKYFSFLASAKGLTEGLGRTYFPCNLLYLAKFSCHLHPSAQDFKILLISPVSSTNSLHQWTMWAIIIQNSKLKCIKENYKN
jgi:hypothetical protein